MCSIYDKLLTSYCDLSWKKFRLLFILAYCRQVTYINKVHTRHFSCVVFVDIFWKIELVSVVDLNKGSWSVLNTLLRNCDFFPCKLGCDGFPWNHSMHSDGSFSQFRVFLFILQFTVFLFFPWQKSGAWGGHGLPSPPSTRPLNSMCQMILFSLIRSNL